MQRNQSNWDLEANEQDPKEPWLCSETQWLLCWAASENSLGFSLPVSAAFTATYSNLPREHVVRNR